MKENKKEKGRELERKKEIEKVVCRVDYSFISHKMNSKEYYACVCCSCRLITNGRRPVTAKSMHLFVATRLFPSHLPNDGYICNKYRLMYIKWKALAEFDDFLTTIDDSHETTNTTILNLVAGQ